jgi:hypothetical protein
MSDISVTLPPEEDPLWLFTREEIENSPSRVDQVSREEEDECRKGASVFIQSVGVQLRLPQLTMATALLFYHRFFALRSLKQYPLLDMSTACLFVAAKLEETPKKLKELVTIAHSIQFPDQPPLSVDSPEFKRERDRILTLERELLQTLCFDFQIDHPYRYLLHYVKQLHGGKELAQSAWSFANDSFRTTLPLQYYARIIGAGCVYLATKKMFPDKTDHEEWFKVFEVDVSTLEDIGRQLMDLYKGSKAEVDQQQQQQVPTMTPEDHEKKPTAVTTIDSMIASVEPGALIESPLPTTLIDGLEKTITPLPLLNDEPTIAADDSVSKSHKPDRSGQESTIVSKDEVRPDSHMKRPLDSHPPPPSMDKHQPVPSRRSSKHDRYEKPATTTYRDSHHYQRHRSRDRSRDRRRDDLDEAGDYPRKRHSHYDDDKDHDNEDYYRRRSPRHRYHEDDDHRYPNDEVDDYYHRGRRDHDSYYYYHHHNHHSKQNSRYRDYSRDRQSRRRH